MNSPFFLITHFEAEIMAARTLMLVFAALFITTLYAAPNPGFRCRNGFDDYGEEYKYEWKTCGASKHACFQSLYCVKMFGVIQFRTHKWQCMDPARCRRGKDGKLTAKHDGVNGICCLKNMCNSYILTTCTETKTL